MNERRPANDAAQIARRMGLSEQLIQRLEALGALRRIELSDAEIRRRLYEGHLGRSKGGRVAERRRTRG